VTAHPAYDPDPDDPIEILLALPQEYHALFRTEYAAAVDNARLPEQFRQLQEMLRTWRLRAIAYSSPGYDGGLAAARDDQSAIVPAAQLIPGWSNGRPRK
jgi:hypothetical protein